MAMRERRLDAGAIGLGDGLGIVAGARARRVELHRAGTRGEGEGVTISVLGWHTGVLGKLVLFVGLAVVLVLVLRELGIEAPATLPQSLLTVALGALATIFVLIRVISVPDDFFFAGRGVGLWISLASAIGVILAGLLQARTSSRARFCGSGSSVRTNVCVPPGTGRSSSASPRRDPERKEDRGAKRRAARPSATGGAAWPDGGCGQGDRAAHGCSPARRGCRRRTRRRSPR